MNPRRRGLKLKLVFFLTLLLVLPLPPDARAEFELNLNKGVAAYLENDYENAAIFLREALKENPDSATANHVLGICLLRLDKVGESVGFLEKAKGLDPNIKGIELDLGTAYLRSGQLEKAVDEFDQAIIRVPDNALAHYNLGYTHFKLGNYEQAIASLDKTYQIDPGLALQSHFYAGVSRFRLRDYPAAKSDFETAEKLGPNEKLGVAAREYIDVIDRLTKRYYGLVSFGFQYDDNVVLEPNEVEVTDQGDGRGVFYLNLGYRPYLSPDALIGLDYSAYFSFHTELEDYNVQDHRFKVYGHKRTSMGKKDVTFYLEYFYDLDLIDGTPASDLFSQTHSLNPRVYLQWSNATATELSYVVQYYDFEDFPERDALNNNIILAQIFRLYEGSLLLKPGFDFAINSADDIEGRRNFDYTAPQIFLKGLAYLPYGLTVFADALWFREDYYNDEFHRVDNQLGVRVIVSKKLYRAFSLDLGYQHISNISDSDVSGPEPFDYSRNIFSATLSARF